MKPALFLGVFLAQSVLAGAQLTYQQLEVQYDSAVVFKNLKVIPVRKKGVGFSNGIPLVGLRQAISRGWVEVSERGTASTENVHWLRINNRSKYPLFIGSGEIVLGGRQDRMVAGDTVLVPNGRDQYVKVMCVEEGRWSEREKKFIHFQFANPRLRRVLGQSGNQVVIWREIIRQLDSNKIHAPGFAYSASRLDKKNNVHLSEYQVFFSEWLRKTDSSLVGMVFVSGNQVIGTDIFDQPFLMADEAMALIEGYSEEAMLNGSVPAASNEKVKKYLDKFLISEKDQESFLKSNGLVFRFRGRVIHITAFGE